ncbi:MAG: hypothetical protein ABSF91_07570 [Bacteroidota bacterium]|jgi:phage FluMu protein Com
MLPKTIKCLDCGQELELEEGERSLEIVKCPTCGKDNKAWSLLLMTQETYQTQYPLLRSYSRGMKIWSWVAGGIFLVLFLLNLPTLHETYEVTLLIAGIGIAISIVIWGWLISEAIKAYADIADNSHRTATLLQVLAKR